MALDTPPISGDLAPFVFDPAAAFALLQVAGVQARVEGEVEHGTCSARVVEPLRPDTPAPGASVSFPFARVADERTRLGAGVNAWNTLRLEPGARLLVAWRALDAGRGLYALRAAASVSESDSREVAETKAALAVQALPPGSPQREARLGESLVTGKDILRRYAGWAVGQRALVPRDVGVRLLAQAIESSKTPDEHDEALAAFLLDPPLYDPDKGADAPNAQVLTLLARRVVTAEPKSAAIWLRYLASRVLPELAEDPDDDAARRRSLIRAVQVPAKAMSERLTLLSTMPGPDAEWAADLLAAWKKAHAS
jgi:hypothetical protein